MKILVGVLLVLYLVEINGRHVEQKEDVQLYDGEEQSDLEGRLREHATQGRHRRRSRQSFGYDYPQPPFYDNRRDYNTRQQEEYFSRIVKSLDEIIYYLRRPAPPPPPVYIPYPVLQYLPCRSQPAATNSTGVPDVTNRDIFKVIEDDNQIWGGSVEPVNNDEEEFDGSRPVSFDPVEPSRPTSRPPPPVEHGSNQAGGETTTVAPINRPGACETAILTCCSTRDMTSQRNCFTRYGCVKTFNTNRACNPEVVKRVLEHFIKTYAPVKRN